MEDPSQQGFWKLKLLFFFFFNLWENRLEKNSQPNLNSYSSGTGWKCVLLVPSSGQSLAELEKTFFTLEPGVECFWKAILQLVCCPGALLGTAFDSVTLVPSLYAVWNSLGEAGEFELNYNFRKWQIATFLRKSLSLRSGPCFVCTASSWLPTPLAPKATSSCL